MLVSIEIMTCWWVAVVEYYNNDRNWHRWKEKGISHRCCRLLHSASCCCSWGNWCCCSGLTSCCGCASVKNGKAGVSKVVGVQTASAGSVVRWTAGWKICLVLELFPPNWCLLGAILIHSRGWVGIFIPSPFLINLSHTLSAILVSWSFPTLMNQVYSFFVLERAGRIVVTLSVVLVWNCAC